MVFVWDSANSYLYLEEKCGASQILSKTSDRDKLPPAYYSVIDIYGSMILVFVIPSLYE